MLWELAETTAPSGAEICGDGRAARSRDRRTAGGLRRQQQQLRRQGSALATLHTQTRAGRWTSFSPELELELIQPHMAQKLVLRGEVGCACVAREVGVERGGMGERGCARRLDGWVWV